MIEKGLIEETKRLAKKYGYDIPSMSAIGYQQIGFYLQGKISLDQATDLIKKDTRNYAKRQLTWFKKDARIHWIDNKEEAEKLIKNFLK